MKGQLLVLAVWLGIALTSETDNTKEEYRGQTRPKSVDMQDVLPTSGQTSYMDPDIQASMDRLNKLEVPKFNYLIPSPNNPMRAHMYPKERELLQSMESGLHKRKVYTNVYRDSLAKAMHDSDIESPEENDDDQVSVPSQKASENPEKAKFRGQQMYKAEEALPTVIHHPYLIRYNNGHQAPDGKMSFNRMYDTNAVKPERQGPTPQKEERAGSRDSVNDPGPGERRQYTGYEEKEQYQRGKPINGGGKKNSRYASSLNKKVSVEQNQQTYQGERNVYLKPESESYSQSLPRPSVHAEVGRSNSKTEVFHYTNPETIVQPVTDRPLIHPVDHTEAVTRAYTAVYSENSPRSEQQQEENYQKPKQMHSQPPPGIFPQQPENGAFSQTQYRSSSQHNEYLRPESRTYPQPVVEAGTRGERHDRKDEGQNNDNVEYYHPLHGVVAQRNERYGSGGYVPFPAPTETNFFHHPDGSPYHSENKQSEGGHRSDGEGDYQAQVENGPEEVNEDSQYQTLYITDQRYYARPETNYNLPAENVTQSSEETSEAEGDGGHYVTQYHTPMEPNMANMASVRMQENRPYPDEDASEYNDEGRSANYEDGEDRDAESAVPSQTFNYEAQLRKSFSDYNQVPDEESKNVGRQRRHFTVVDKGDSKSGQPSPSTPLVTYVPLRIGGFFGDRSYKRPIGYMHFPSPYLAFSPYKQYRNHPFYRTQEYKTLLQGNVHPLDKRNKTNNLQDVVHHLPETKNDFSISARPKIRTYGKSAPRETVVYTPKPFVHAFTVKKEYKRPEPTNEGNPFRAVYLQYRNHPFYRIQRRRNRESERNTKVEKKRKPVKVTVFRPRKRTVQGKEGAKEPAAPEKEPKVETLYSPPPAIGGTFRPVPYVLYNTIPDYDPNIHDVSTTGSEPKYKPVNGTKRYCYRCGWSKDEPEPKTQLARVRGWKRCVYAFHHDEAEPFGIEEEVCYDNCYIKVDKNNSVFRGCYAGEVGVDPKQTGCHKQGDDGSVFCFCDGPICNNSNSPEFF